MTQISILSGVKTDSNAAVLDALPINLEPSLVTSGASEGTLTSTPGITQFSPTVVGSDKISINWNGVNYRIQGSKLISVDVTGIVTILGDVGDDAGFAFMDYSFDRLAISSNSNLFYYDGNTLTQVTDPNLGVVKSLIFNGGYFLYTDGTTIVNTTLANPYVINPLSYGSADIDPDGIQGLINIRNEVTAVGQYTVQPFQNIGGSGFPFAPVLSAYTAVGAVGAKAFCEFNKVLALVGSAKNESIGVFLVDAGTAVPIHTSAVIDILQSMSIDDQALIELEKVVHDNEQRLYMHLPDKTLVYNYNASIANQTPIWYILAGGIYANQQYPLRHMSFVYNKYIGADPVSGKIGYLDHSVSTMFGATSTWSFVTNYVYDAGIPFTITDVELVCATGRTPIGLNPTVFFSYSLNGTTFSQERATPQGKIGEYQKRIAWRPMCQATNYLNMKFRGSNTSIATIMRLEATIEEGIK